MSEKKPPRTKQGKFIAKGDYLKEIASLSGYPRPGTPSWRLLEQAVCVVANMSERYGVHEMTAKLYTGLAHVKCTPGDRRGDEPDRWKERFTKETAAWPKEKNSIP